MEYKCDKCEEIFTIKKEYEEHMKLEPCVIRMYVDKGDYETFEEVPYFSELYSFKQNASGDNIQRVKQEENGEKIYQCKFCEMMQLAKLALFLRFSAILSHF